MQQNNQENSLKSTDFSKVWQDGGNKLEGLKLDLVDHLKKQRGNKDWNQAKDTLIQNMNLHQFSQNQNQEISILDIGCGLGIDLILMADEVKKLGLKATIIGIDFNSQMVEHAQKLISEQKEQFEDSIKINVIKGDITDLENVEELKNLQFDFIRSDITLQHVDLQKTLKGVHKLLKPQGHFISLEPACGNFYCKDKFVQDTYDKVIPEKREGLTSIQLLFQLKELGFNIIQKLPITFISDGNTMTQADTNWTKLKGLGIMLVKKNILTQEVVDEYTEKYIKSCENNEIYTISTTFIIKAQKI